MEEYVYRVGDHFYGIALYYVPKTCRKEPVSSMVAYMYRNGDVALMGNYDADRDADAVARFCKFPID